MYVTEDNKTPQAVFGRCTRSALLTPERDTGADMVGAWDESLEFVPSVGWPISAAQYACWHALVKEHLSVSKIWEDNFGARSIDLHFAQLCLGEIDKVHRYLDGSSSVDKRSDQLEFTPEQREKLRKLQEASWCIPKGLAHEILGFSEQRQQALNEEAKKLLCFLGVMLASAVSLSLLGWIHANWNSGLRW
jgi:hypothetical protein